MVRFRGHEEEREYHALDLTLLKRIWPFVYPYRRAFGLCFLSLFVSFGLEVVRPYLLRRVLDGPVKIAREGGEVDLAPVWELGTWFFFTTLGSVILGYVYTWTTTYNAQRVIRDVRSQLYRHLLRVSPRYFDKNPAGKLVTRVTSDVENLNELIATGVLQTSFDLLRVVGVIPILFFIRWQLALFILAIIPVLVVTSVVFRKYARDSFRRVRGDQARLNGFAAEAVGGITATRIFGREELVQDHFKELNDKTKRSWLQTVFYFSLFFALVELVIHLSQAGLLYVGGTLILQQGMSAGEFAQFWLYLAYITEPIKQLGEKYNVLQSSFASSERIFQILDQPVSPPSPEAPQPGSKGPAELRCEDVHFAYKTDTPVLNGVSVTFRASTTTAIVGPTGAGKTTLLGMLSRLQDPDSGARPHRRCQPCRPGPRHPSTAHRRSPPGCIPVYRNTPR